MDYKEKVIALLKSQELSKEQKEKLESIFPELAVNEDEKIRQFLIHEVTETSDEIMSYRNMNKEDVLAWLEKQQKPIDPDTLIQQRVDALADIVAEQKPTDKAEPKFENGQWIVWQDKCYKVNYNGCGYELVDQDGLSTSLEYGTIDKNAHIWDITKDAKDGDVLCCESGWTCLFKALDNHTNTFSSYCFMDSDKWFCETGSKCHTLNKEFMKAYNGEIKPATKEQRDLLFAKMKEVGYKWYSEKKELKKDCTVEPIENV